MMMMMMMNTGKQMVVYHLELTVRPCTNGTVGTHSTAVYFRHLLWYKDGFRSSTIVSLSTNRHHPFLSNCQIMWSREIFFLATIYSYWIFGCLKMPQSHDFGLSARNSSVSELRSRLNSVVDFYLYDRPLLNNNKLIKTKYTTSKLMQQIHLCKIFILLQHNFEYNLFLIKEKTWNNWNHSILFFLVNELLNIEQKIKFKVGKINRIDYKFSYPDRYIQEAE